MRFCTEEMVPARWPHIRRFVRFDPCGRAEEDFQWWLLVEGEWEPAERAAAHDEWADFFEWQLLQRADELSVDDVKHRLVAAWTDSMAYSCRRLAARARGENPGEWVPQHVRRPELVEETDHASGHHG